MGQIIFSYDKNDSVDISELTNGIYFVRIIDVNNASMVKKIIKK